MLIEIQQKLSQYESYWKLRKWLKLKSFNVSRAYYSLRQKLSNYKQVLSALFIMYKAVFVYFLLPILIATFTQCIELPTRSWFVANGWVILKDSDYSTLVATVTSISGLFIGLYYAAMTTIGGAIYSKVPHSLRQLLLNERYGNAYLNYLVSFTFWGILLLAQYVSGYRVNPINVLLIVLFGGFAVFAFFQIGVRALSLFEPTEFAGEIFNNISKSVKRLLPGASHWDSPAFQKHEHKNVQHWLETVHALAEIAASEKHLSGKVFINFTQKIARFLSWYEYQKDRIPRNSEWFTLIHQHPDWYQTSDIETSLAHRSGHILEPIKVPNFRWLEKELSGVLFSCLRLNLVNQNYPLAMQTIGCIEMYLDTISAKGDMNWAFEVLSETTSACEEHINEVVKNEDDQTAELIGLCDYVAYLPINACLTFLNSLSHRDGVTISKLIDEINWNKKNSVYKEQLSEATIKRLEWFKERMEFEHEVEGQFITPDWYIKNEICKLEAIAFVQNTNVIIKKLGEMYTSWVKNLTFSRRYWLASACSVREKEFWYKISYQINVLSDYWQSLLKNQKHDNSWTIFDVEALNETLENKNKSVEQSRTVLLANLINKERPDEFPDYSGVFLHSQGESLFEALLSNDESRIFELYPSYYLSSFYQFSKLLPQSFSKISEAEAKAKVASAALIDLLELTGYALVLMRFYSSTNISDWINNIWERHLSDSAKLSQLMAMVNMFDSAFEIPHRNEHRFNWKRSVYEKVSSGVEKKEIYRKGSYFHAEKLVKHNDPLVRLFAKEGLGLNHQGLDVFVTEILIPKLERPKQDLGKFRRDLRNRIQREVERYEEYQRGEFDE